MRSPKALRYPISRRPEEKDSSQPSKQPSDGISREEALSIRSHRSNRPSAVQPEWQSGKQSSRVLQGIYMNYSKTPTGTAATSPLLFFFEAKQGLGPAHRHSQTHKDAQEENGVPGFHGATRRADNGQDDGEKKWKTNRVREAEFAVKTQSKCCVEKIYHLQAADRPWG